MPYDAAVKPQQTSDAWKSIDFLSRLAADCAVGRLRPLLEYRRMFPGAGPELEREYEAALQEQVVGGDSERQDGTLGSYRLLKELGHGGQGSVWLALDLRLDRQVALKIMRSAIPGREGAARLKREAMLASKLEHPGICTVFEVGELEGDAYIAMQYIPGESLRDLLDRAREQGQRGLELGDHQDTNPSATATSAFHWSGDQRGLIEAVWLIEEVARAVHCAHGRGILHRDIKPGNIMVTPQGRPVLLDFGVARDESGTHPTLTHPDALLGTPAYMSPERLESNTAIGPETDVWALGVVLYECLCLERPFAGSTRHALYDAIRDKNPVRPDRINDRIPRELCDVLEVALDKDPARRYRTAEEFAEDLRRVRELEPIHARPPGRVVRAVRWAQRNRTVAASLLLAFLSLTGALVSAVIGWSREAELLRTTQRQFAELRKLSASYLYDLHDGLRNSPGATLAKKQLAEKALAYLDVLERHPQAGFDLRLDRIAAHLRVGDVLGNGRYANLGRPYEALAHFEQALGIVKDLARERPESPQVQRSMISCYERLGNIHETTGEMGQALECYRTAIDLVQESDPANAQLRVNLMVQLGDALLLDAETKNRRQEALANFEAALHILTSLARSGPERLGLAVDAATIQTRIGATMWTLGNYEDAVPVLAAARRTLEGLPAEQQRLLPYRHALANCYQTLGRHELNLGHTETAEKLLTKAIELLRSVVELDPYDALALRRLVGSHVVFGEVCNHRGQRDRALKEYGLALEMTGRRVTGQARSWVAKSSAIIHTKMGATYYAKLGLTEALKHFELARGFLEEPIARGTADAGTQLTYVSCLGYTAQVYRRSRRPDDARLWYEKAITACKQLDALNPGNRQFMEARMAILQGTAALAMNQQRVEEAVRYLREGIEVGKRKQALFKDAASALDLATLERTLAFALLNQSVYDEARTIYARVITRLEDLISRDPDNYRAQCCLAVTLVELARLFVVQPDEEAAKEGYRRARAYAGRLAAKSGGRDPKVTLVIASSWALEAIDSKRGQRLDAAMRALDRLDEVLESLSPEERKQFTYRREIDDLRKKLDPRKDL